MRAAATDDQAQLLSVLKDLSGLQEGSQLDPVEKGLSRARAPLEYESIHLASTTVPFFSATYAN